MAENIIQGLHTSFMAYGYLMGVICYGLYLLAMSYLPTTDNINQGIHLCDIVCAHLTSDVLKGNAISFH